jgi:hypothetical protein
MLQGAHSFPLPQLCSMSRHDGLLAAGSTLEAEPTRFTDNCRRCSLVARNTSFSAGLSADKWHKLEAADVLF